jgi:hypothetical protein
MIPQRNVQWSKTQPTDNPPGYQWAAVRGPNGEPLRRKGALKWELLSVDKNPGRKACPAQAGT